jgi:restriction system protein
MAKRSSFIAGWERAAMAAARAQRAAEAEQRRKARERQREEREKLRRWQQQNKAQREQYLASRQAETDRLNADLAAEVDELRAILAARQMPTEDSVFECLEPKKPPPVLNIPAELNRTPPQPVKNMFIRAVKPMTWWENLFGLRSRYLRRVAAAEQQFQKALADYEAYEKDRKGRIEALQLDYDQRLSAHKSELAEAQEAIADLRRRYHEGEAQAVTVYHAMAIEQSSYPESFPHKFRVAYDPSEKHLIFDYELPTAEILPRTAEHRFIKTKDLVEEKPRKASEIRELYAEIVAAVALRCVHESFAADASGQTDIVTFSGYVNTIDPATGNPIHPYLISVRVTRARFATLQLDRVETKACLRNLGAQVSPQPAELLAVKPIIEFDMVDKRFIDEKDVISELDARPNLMDLTPAEFEALVGNLFTRMGLETKLTRTNRDGGVDAVAFDTRPILGGKVVIQAKRYRNTVGVAAVRDLYGTMINEGANKGILVTTSSYGPDAYDFCKDKPIELVNGSGLLFHLDQVGVKAKIIFPDDTPTTA